MNEISEYRDERFSVQIIDGCVYIVYLKEYVDYDYVNDLINARLKLIGNQTLPIFSDFRKVKKGTREARERMAGSDAGIGVSAVAVYIDSAVHKIIFSFFNSIYKAPAPTKLFTNKEKALEWLEQYKQ
jgi:hypothetical protein